MPGNTETAGEPEEKPAPGRIRPGWDTAAVVRAQEKAEGAASPCRTAPGRLQYAETPGTDSVPDYLGEIGRYDAGESSHRSGSFGSPGALLPEKYRDIPERADFSEKSGYVPTGAGNTRFGLLDAIMGQWRDTGYDDPIYEYVNGNQDAILKQFTKESTSGSTVLGTDSRFLNNLNDTERKTYNYIHATQGKDAANEFLRDLEQTLNARQRENEEAYWSKEAEKNPTRMSVFSILTKPLSIYSYIQQADKWAGGEEIDPDAGYNRGAYTSNAIRNTISRKIEESGKWGKVGSYGYNLAMSMSDFLYTSGITGGMEPLALTVMGTEAAADSVLAAKERGLSDKRSFIIGTAAGVIEAATEKIGFDALFKTGVRGLGKAGFRRYILRNAGAEAAEEGASDLLNWIADDLYDLVTETKESEFKAVSRQFNDTFERVYKTAKGNLAHNESQLAQFKQKRDELKKWIEDIRLKIVKADAGLKQLEQEKKISSAIYQDLLLKENHVRIAAEQGCILVRVGRHAKVPTRPGRR